jgi:hypothetical protein
VSGKGDQKKLEEPKVKLQYAINREEEEELNKSDHEISEEEDEIKSSSSSSSSDEAKSYVIPEDDDLSTVGIMDEVQPQKDSMKNLSIDQIRGATSPTKQSAKPIHTLGGYSGYSTTYMDSMSSPQTR